MHRGHFVVAAAAVLGGCTGEGPDQVRVREEAAALSHGHPTLDVVASSKLPVPEVSGLAARGSEYLAVGDKDTSVVTFELDGPGFAAIAAHDMSSLFAHGHSQWEAIAADGGGRVFLLDESRAEIAVVERDLSRVAHTFELVVPPAHPLANAWADDDNSRGEGMVLLANGHVLVAKEKKPPALIEFAPRGERAEGYRPALALRSHAFAVPDGSTSELVATSYWLVDDTMSGVLEDISELALDAAGTLLLLSQKGRALAKAEGELAPSATTIPLDPAYVRVPSTVDKPEGLVPAGAHLLVTSDEPHAHDEALFELAAP